MATFIRNPLAKSPLDNAQAPTIPLPDAPQAPALTDYSGKINGQFDTAKSILNNQKNVAGASALENAQRAAATRGTAGAGFESKIQDQAVNDATKPYLDQATSLDSQRASQLTAAGQTNDALKEQQRQFDFNSNLQRYTSANEMDLNKLSTFVNASTALYQGGFDSPQSWQNFFAKSPNGTSPVSTIFNSSNIATPFQ